MRVLVTGANGFLGRGLAQKLARDTGRLSRLVLTDIGFSEGAPAGADTVVGDLGDPDFLDALLEPEFDLIFHLASIPGGLAETAPDLAFRANLVASLELARRASTVCSGARFVFASSIAVYGELTGQTVTERTPLSPLLSYGAHKLMTEIFLTDMTRRGALSAISLRFPGIVARPQAQSGHGSAFMSLIFHKIAAGEPYHSPVPTTASCWWMSRTAAVSALIHAASLGSEDPTVVQPPVLVAAIGDIAIAIERVSGRRAKIQWGNDRRLTRLFGAMPLLDAGPSLKLGFRTDTNMDALARAALSGDLS